MPKMMTLSDEASEAWGSVLQKCAVNVEFWTAPRTIVEQSIAPSLIDKDTSEQCESDSEQRYDESPSLSADSAWTGGELIL
jgi:hypothetical protein